MADEDNDRSRSTRVGLLIGGIVVAALIVAGVVVGVNIAAGNTDDDTPSGPSLTASADLSTDPSAVAAGDSVCGLGGEELDGTVTAAPEATWKHQDVFSYPVSATAGPAETAPEGYRFCYQHSPEGAVLAAVNATVIAFSSAIRAEWLEYGLSAGPHRDDLLASEVDGDDETDPPASIVGFRMLEYTGDTARIDVAFEVAVDGQPAIISVSYDLVWSDGDWKLDTSYSLPARVGRIADLTGYIAWSDM